jgi:hypothetical protein
MDLHVTNDWLKPINYTDYAFVHLRRIHILDKRRCDQVTDSQAAFIHLHGFPKWVDETRRLSIILPHLKGIYTLRKIFRKNQCHH